MGLLDKIKNLFTDEEEIIETEEIEAEEEKKEEVEEHPLPTFMREKIEKEERSRQEPKEDIIQISDINLTREHREIKENNSFKFPIVFDEQDFEPEPTKTIPVIEKQKEEVKKNPNLYNSAKSSNKKEVKKFKPTPIISPVYGILDKNYKKEEVKSKPENTYQITRASSKKVDFETVRMKAFGTLSDEINDNLLHDSLVDDTNVEVIDPSNLLYEITTDKDTTIANAEENYYDFGVSYEIPKPEIRETVPMDNEIKIVNHNEEEVKAEKIEVKEEIIKSPSNTVVEDASSESDLELTEDLFSLIDAMYDERNGN